MQNLSEISDFLQYLGDGVLIVDEESKIVFANEACGKLFGYEHHKMIGMNISKLIHPDIQIDHKHLVRQYVETRAPSRAMMNRGEMLCQNATGGTFHARISIATSKIQGKQYGVASIQDFTSLHNELAELEISSHHDILTGVYNRRYFQNIINPDSRILNSWKHIGVLYIDLNKFKSINDTHGHAIGDRALLVSSNRIKGCVRFDDIVLRMGGDEFLVLLNLTDIDEKRQTIKQVARKIQSKFTNPIEVEKLKLPVGMSAGCALFPDDGNDLEKLVDLADKAMYLAKQNGQDIQFI